MCIRDRRGIVERLLEAIQRGLWEDPPEEMLQKLREMYLDIEADIEARQEGNSSGNNTVD